VPHGNINADGSFTGPDGQRWNADAGDLALVSTALANQQRPETEAQGLVQVGLPGAGSTDFSPDWQAPNLFKASDVPPPWVPDSAVSGDAERGGTPSDNPALQGPQPHAQTSHLLGQPGYMQDTMGSAAGIGPGDYGWSREMAAPRYYIVNNRIIDRIAAKNWEAPGPDEAYNSRTGFHSGAALGFPRAAILPGGASGYQVAGYPGDTNGWALQQAAYTE
jgi:hypothetical protein